LSSETHGLPLPVSVCAAFSISPGKPCIYEHLKPINYENFLEVPVYPLALFVVYFYTVLRAKDTVYRRNQKAILNAKGIPSNRDPFVFFRGSELIYRLHHDASVR
jgi:hypothetical protein